MRAAPFFASASVIALVAMTVRVGIADWPIVLHVPEVLRGLIILLVVGTLSIGLPVLVILVLVGVVIALLKAAVRAIQGQGAKRA